MYDRERMKQAFEASNHTLETLSAKAGVALSTVHRIINFGTGRKANVDAVAKALGFKRGRMDVLVPAPVPPLPVPLTEEAKQHMVDLEKSSEQRLARLHNR